MKNLTFAFLGFFILFFMSSCGDSECFQADWVGTYNLVEGDCELASETIAQTIVIAAGSTDSTIIVTGLELPFNNCIVEIGVEGVMQLDGTTLQAAILSCEGTYERQ